MRKLYRALVTHGGQTVSIDSGVDPDRGSNYRGDGAALHIRRGVGMVTAVLSEQDARELRDILNEALTVPEFNPDDFDPKYKLNMILAYPQISGLTSEELWESTPEGRDDAFDLILNSRHLAETHRQYLIDKEGQQ